MSELVKKLREGAQALADYHGGDGVIDDAVADLRAAADRIARLEAALKTADGTITALEKCGVRAPCSQCDRHINHGRTTIRDALSSTEGDAP